MVEREIKADIVLDEDETHTAATARLHVAGADFEGRGLARRNPGDPNVPAIGEDLAIARALADLSHRLIEAAVNRIEAFEGRHVSITH